MNSEEMQKGESSPASTIGWNIAMHFLPEEFGPQPVGNDSNRKNTFWVHGTIKKSYIRSQKLKCQISSKNQSTLFDLGVDKNLSFK